MKSIKNVISNKKGNIIFNGMILGMKEMGANLVDIDDNHLYFEIKRGSDIDNDEKIAKSKEAFNKSFGLGMKIKKIY